MKACAGRIYCKHTACCSTWCSLHLALAQRCARAKQTERSGGESSRRLGGPCTSQCASVSLLTGEGAQDNDTFRVGSTVVCGRWCESGLSSFHPTLWAVSPLNCMSNGGSRACRHLGGKEGRLGQSPDEPGTEERVLGGLLTRSGQNNYCFQDHIAEAHEQSQEGIAHLHSPEPWSPCLSRH